MKGEYFHPKHPSPKKDKAFINESSHTFSNLYDADAPSKQPNYPPAAGDYEPIDPYDPDKPNKLSLVETDKR